MIDRMKHGLTLLWLAAFALGGPASAADDKKGLPEGWFVTESSPQLYEAGLDTQGPCEGNRSAWLRSRQGEPAGYGTFMQAFGAGAFRGKRLRFSAVVRTEDVKGWSGLWMRVEGEDAREPLAFDNMQSRALVGTTACKRHEVVLDVPQDARSIMAGLMLSGTGKAWIGAVRFETVDTSVPVTNLLADRGRREEQPTGRIGDVWFNRKQVEASNYRALLKPDGSWSDNYSNTLSVSGGTVRGTWRQLPLRLTVKTEGSSTRLEGQWGREPVRIELSPEKLTLKHGIFERELTREDERPEYDRSCIRYRRGDGLSRSDEIDVCGEALRREPPLAQLVLAFLNNGFRAVPPPHVRIPAPSTPPRNVAAPDSSH
ncbi:AraC family transcriptional regulator [Archangium violaceum]|uniref:AraC family transcriptional regulator n=1 Tax=Archangium violaceum TaxID=83451 RepID=UPI00194EA3F7|nr:AraC family transcriptional regulator [Archangium violaceum]QRN95132.1 AraC family transcriptional regulator [Archangium violaceum]